MKSDSIVLKKFRLAYILLVFICTISSASCQGSGRDKDLTCDEIIELYLDAKGGIDKLKSVKSYSATIMDQQKEIHGESIRKFPDKLCDIIRFPGGERKSLLNGDKAQLILSDKILPITNPSVLRGMKEDAMIFPELYPEILGYKRTYGGKVELDGTMHHIIKVSLADNSKREYFYNSKTWLLNKSIDENGVQSRYSDYRKIEGIMISHSIKVVSENETLNLKVSQVKINNELDEKIFTIK